MHVPDPPSDDEIRARLRRAADRNLPKKSRDQDDPTLDPEETRVMHIEDELGRLDVSTEPHRRRLPENDPAFAERLSRLEARADRVRESREQAQAKVQRAHGVAQKDAQNLGRGMAIVYAFIGFPVIGVGCGAVVAHWTHSTAALSVGGFIGIVVGCLCAVVLVKWSDRRS